MERAALEPHPRWRRFVDRATQPRVLVAIGAAALLLGAGAIFVSQQLLSDDERPAAASRADRTRRGQVAVLNGTSINGLAGKVASDVEAAGYERRSRSPTREPGFANTAVLYADRQKPAAQKVAATSG